MLPQEKRRQKMLETDRECTFAPQLTASKGPRPTSAAETKDKGNRFLRLYEQARVAQARAEVARARTDGDCTFRPELVTRKSMQVTRDGNVFDTLYKKVWRKETCKPLRGGNSCGLVWGRAVCALCGETLRVVGGGGVTVRFG